MALKHAYNIQIVLFSNYVTHFHAEFPVQSFDAIPKTKKIKLAEPFQVKTIAPTKYFSIITINTGAGSLGSFRKFFANAPNDCPHSFVIIQHLSFDYKWPTSELLPKNTTLPISKAKALNLTGRSIYVTPPRQDMTIDDRKLILVNTLNTND